MSEAENTQVIEAEPALPLSEPVSTPARLLEHAMNSGADLDRLEQLMDMQIKWEQNEARKAYVLAMSKFRSEVPTIARDTPGHNNRYASLDVITRTVNPILAKYGLSFAWVTEQQGPEITVHCDVTHELGHSQRVSLTSGPENSGSKNAIQAIGSAVKYLQRYTLSAALGLASGDGEDDGRGTAAITITEEQSFELDALIEDNNLDRPAVMNWLKSSFGYESLSDVMPKDFGKIKSTIQRKVNANS